ncbi:MAG: protein translocase subunit SecD [Oligoflexales bacterium]
MNSPRNRILLTLALTLFAIYSVSPTFYYFSMPKEIRNDSAEFQKRLPDWLPEKHIKLGLDLQGGVQLVLGVDTETAVENKMGRLGIELTRWANEEKPQVKSAFVPKGEPVLRVELEPGVNISEFKGKVQKEYFAIEEAKRSDNRIDFRYAEDQVKGIRDAALQQAERVVRNRVDKWGVSEPSISRRADGSILVQLPGFKDPSKARELLGRTAQLSFKLIDEEDSAFQALAANLPPNIKAEKRGNFNAMSFISEDKDAILKLVEGKIPEGREVLFEENQIAGGKKVEYTSHLVASATELSGEDVLDAVVNVDSSSFDSKPVVSLTFTGTGGKRFSEITGANINKRLAIVLDNAVVSDPVIITQISGGKGQITMGGNKSYNEIVEEANQLALILKSGALPAPIKVLEERQVGATLGPELANQGILSVIVGLAFVLAFMLVYYKRPGLIGCVALIINGIFLLALMAGFGFALTLPGLAGFILTLGMAVDANVLINERIRQELFEGKAVKRSVEVGFAKVFWTIIDSNVTTLIAALVLLETNASGPIKGFAISLIIGLIVSLFTSLYSSKAMFEYVISGSKTDKELRNWVGGTGNARVFNFNFLSTGKVVSKLGIALAVIVTVAGVWKGMNWSVDFAGGTEIEMIFNKSVEPDKIRSAMKAAGVEDPLLQSIGDGQKQYLIRFEGKSDNPAEAEKIRTTLSTQLADFGGDIQRVDFVGPQVGKELRKQGIMSVIWAIIGVMIYIGLRFDMRFAPGLVAKMIQDIFVIMGFYIFFHRSFDLTSVAALLTAIGYSVNDTIVIYDRIRENLVINPRRTLSDNVNISLNETLSRSINTSILTMLSLIGILVFTTSQIWDFAAAMAVGIVSATISSTYVASSFLVWSEDFKRKLALKKAGRRAPA